MSDKEKIHYHDALKIISDNFDTINCRADDTHEGCGLFAPDGDHIVTYRCDIRDSKFACTGLLIYFDYNFDTENLYNVYCCLEGGVVLFRGKLYECIEYFTGYAVKNGLDIKR